MGKADQGRREGEQRRDDRGRAGNRGRAGRPDFRFSLVAAARLVGGPDSGGADLDDVIELLSDGAHELGSAGAALVVDDVFSAGLAATWEGGWQPAEVVRAVRRRRSARHAELMSTAIASEQAGREADPPPQWTEQLVELGAGQPWWGGGGDWLQQLALRAGLSWPETLTLAVETLGVLVWLPRIELLLPPPTRWASIDFAALRSMAGVDEAVLAKVRALLAKAESTTFEHEADALTAKAQQLMARHAIDEAVASSEHATVRETPTVRRVAVDDPYATAKSALLAVVASANGVRAVWDEDFAHMTLIGFEGDVEAVEMLFTSLLMQASRGILAKGQVADGRGRSRTRSFRQSFYLAFSQRIHERLEMATRQARQEAERELGRDLLPVLAGRRDEVDAATGRLFPCLRRARASSITNEEGWRAGRAAAEMAHLGPVREHLDTSTG